MTARRRAGAAATVAAAGGLAGALGFRELLRHQARLARRAISKPLGERPPVADRVWKPSYGHPIDLLLLGDSIAAGLGAPRPRQTLGGHLARRVARRAHRSVRLRVAAVVGGNDVTHRVRPTESARHLGAAIERLTARGTAVVVATCPDLAAVGALPQPLRTFGSRASRQLAAVQREVAVGLGAEVVPLADVVGRYFMDQPDAMFAEDGFHPSGAGYRWAAKALVPAVLAALG